MTESHGLLTYLGYDFVQNALIAGTAAAVLGAIVGYFVVIRSVSFAAHALSHIGFAGAAGAALLGLSPLQGMLLLTVGAGAFMGAAGDRVHRSDLAIGMVLSASLGLGDPFSEPLRGLRRAGHGDFIRRHFRRRSGADPGNGRPRHHQPRGARPLFPEAPFRQHPAPAGRGARVVAAGSFDLLHDRPAVSVTLASQIVGILLVFTLVIAPAGIALRLCRSFWSGMLASIALGVAGVWAGILLACVTNLPVTFWITALFFLLYLATEIRSRIFSTL